MTSATRASRADVLRFRVAAQQLDRTGSHTDAAILDLGVQETGPVDSGWALAIRGAEVPADDLFLAWSLRGAPHAYRRAQAARVAAATSPWSDVDAAKRIFTAAKPLKEAGIPALAALDRVAEEMRALAEEPISKGDLSGALRDRLPEPYLRWCNPCQVIHIYEQPFRLAALRAGLELEPGTSPPVLHRIPRWRGAAKTVPADLDVVRGVLRFLGPSTPKLVAGYVDAPVREVAAHWPEDVVPVEVDGALLDVLADDLGLLTDPPVSKAVRLLGPFDLFLQGRDRELVVRDADARTDLWRTIGRPGAVLAGHEVVGTWRPRSKGKRLGLAVEIWTGGKRPPGVAEQAERLAAHRGQAFDGFVSPG